MKEPGRIEPEKLKSLLEDLKKTRVAVVGDFCLDVYWFSELSASEKSIETDLDTRPVARQRCSLGGAGNVVANLLDLGCGSVHALGVIGNDPWGKEMLRILGLCGADVTGIETQEDAWATLTYVKPCLDGNESNRFDFGNFNSLLDETGEKLIRNLENVLPDMDAVILNQQVRQGIHTPWFRNHLNELMLRNPSKIFVLDSRHYSEAYPGAILKLNAEEAARLTGIDRGPDALILKSEAISAAKTLHQKTGKPVFVTRGDRGSLVYDAQGLVEIPGLHLLGKTDPVGAGDSYLAGLTLALAAKRSPGIAATLGGFVAGVTVQKLFQTGTASPGEVQAIGVDPDYIYRPELAEDARGARFVEGTEFEVVTGPRSKERLTHAIFDHDGTLSVLREGWEHIMEPMMVRAILGPKFKTADESLYHMVLKRIREFIDKSTGIQTLVQMQGLVAMTREFKCVPEKEILDEFGYKKIYNDALLDMVRGRMHKLNQGELAVEDFAIKNAVKLLERLHCAGVRMYLASGTDEGDVIAEAKAMGYAHLFEGGIYGAVGDATKEAKKMVLERILREVGPENTSGLIAFGDGPVEIRETHKRGGYAVGIASDELKRFGLNHQKRKRLIRAGADLIIADYSQLDRLLEYLGVRGI